MNIPADCHLAYVVSHEAWYARYPGVVPAPELSVSASVPGNGCAWNFSVEEKDFGSHGTAICLKIFEDAFAAFADIGEFFTALAADGITTLDGVRKLLDSLGAADETKREQP